MVQLSRELDFPLLAGSSLPVTRRLPQVDMTLGARVEEAMCVAVRGVDGYDIHALEAMQSMVERRRGGESGVAWIHAVRGQEAVMAALRSGSFDAGGWDPELFRACLCRSHRLVPTRQGFNHHLPSSDEIQGRMTAEDNSTTPVLYRYQHRDGLKMSMLLIEGVVNDFTFAARLAEKQKPLSLQMFLPPREVCNFQGVPRSEFADIEDLAEGMEFEVESDAGPVVITVVEIGDEIVQVDGNHALAGMTLNFDVTVCDVREATAEEIEHGHAHGEGGHSH